jgi:hypothetical protein
VDGPALLHGQRDRAKNDCEPAGGNVEWQQHGTTPAARVAGATVRAPRGRT